MLRFRKKDSKELIKRMAKTNGCSVSEIRREMQYAIDEARNSDEYSCAMKSHFRKFGNQSSGTRKSPILCLITYPFLLRYWSRPCRICGA